MDLIDEEHLSRLERSEHTGEVTGLIQHRSGGNLDPHTELIGNDLREGGLPQSGWTVKENVIERLTPHLRRLDKDAEITDHIGLTGEVLKALWPQELVGIPPPLLFRESERIAPKLDTTYVEVLQPLYLTILVAHVLRSALSVSAPRSVAAAV